MKKYIAFIASITLFQAILIAPLEAAVCNARVCITNGKLTVNKSLCFGRMCPTGGAPVIPLFVNEDFETAGTPSGWFVAGADPDYTGFVLAGLQSLKAEGGNGGSVQYAFYDHTDYDETWYQLLYRIQTFPASGTVQPLKIDNSSFGTICTLFIFTDGTATVDFSTYSPVGSFASGTTYYVWAHYEKGPNGTCEYWWGTSSSRASASYHLANNAISGTDQDSQFYVILTSSATAEFEIADNVQGSNADAFGP